MAFGKLELEDAAICLQLDRPIAFDMHPACYLFVPFHAQGLYLDWTVAMLCQGSIKKLLKLVLSCNGFPVRMTEYDS